MSENRISKEFEDLLLKEINSKKKFDIDNALGQLVPVITGLSKSGMSDKDIIAYLTMVAKLPIKKEGE